jgi:putative transposase
MREPAGGRDERAPSVAELEAAQESVRLARDREVALTGPDGLLKALTKTVIETDLDEEMAEHLLAEGRQRRTSRRR